MDCSAASAPSAARSPNEATQPTGFARRSPSARPTTEIEKEAIANGLSRTTLQRAFRDLGGKATRVGFGPLGIWFWQLPGVGERNPPATSDDLWIESLVSGTL